MAATSEYKIVQGPDRIDLSVGLFHVGKHGHQELAVFRVDPPWHSHANGNEVEVLVTCVEAVDRIIGTWRITGKVDLLDLYVSIEYSTYNQEGVLRFVPRT